MIASRKMFDESERLHPLQESEKIKVENIKGKIIFVGAEDDALWDTCKYIRRMEQRLEDSIQRNARRQGSILTANSPMRFGIGEKRHDG